MSERGQRTSLSESVVVVVMMMFIPVMTVMMIPTMMVVPRVAGTHGNRSRTQHGKDKETMDDGFHDVCSVWSWTQA